MALHARAAVLCCLDRELTRFLQRSRNVETHGIDVYVCLFLYRGFVAEIATHMHSG